MKQDSKQQSAPAYTPELKKAVAHVKKVFPSLAIVVFNSQGRWQYMDEDFGAFKFDTRIDVKILEDASDSMTILPVIFKV